MKPQTMAGKLLLVSSACILLVCNSYAQDAAAPSPQPNASPAVKVLAKVELQDGQTVEFREFPSGMLSVTENTKIFHTPLHLGNMAAGKSMVDIYRMLQPKSEVPDSLVAADARLNALRSKPASIPLPDPPHLDGGGGGPKPYNAGEQIWFKQTFCHDDYGTDSLVSCIQAFDWISTKWRVGAVFTFDSMAGSEGTALANIHVYYWNGSQEVQLALDTVRPGWVRGDTYYYYQPFWWHVNLDGAGANTQVSQALRTCGNGGEWACSHNCQGSIACDPQRSTYCQIVGGAGESWCNSQ